MVDIAITVRLYVIQQSDFTPFNSQTLWRLTVRLLECLALVPDAAERKVFGEAPARKLPADGLGELCAVPLTHRGR